MLKRILLYWRTVRHLALQQIFARFTFMAKRRLLLVEYARRISRAHFGEYLSLPFLIIRPVNTSVNKIDFANRHFSFQNVAIEFPDAVNWNDTSVPLLWRYHLHYFDYLIPTTETINTHTFAICKDLLRDWIKQNPVGEGPGWEPYPLSLRLVNLLFWTSRYHHQIAEDSDFEALLCTSLYQQTEFLSNYFEYHLQANHLFENSKSLFIAGLCLNRPGWIKRGWRELEKQLEKQILPDGGHYERSPSYHSIVLCGLLDVLNAIRQCDNTRYVGFDKAAAERLLIETSRKMLACLMAFSHPDGNLSLFGDTAFDTQLTVEQLTAYAERLRIEDAKINPQLQMPDTGYCVLQSEHQYLILDTGPLGVRHQPGHAHADLLSYEYSFMGKRFVVDSGVGEYLPTPLRKQSRGTAAHNTIYIDGFEQMEAWGAFRVGRWIDTAKIDKPTISEMSVQCGYTCDWQGGDSFSHKRTVSLHKADLLLIQDVVDYSGEQAVRSLIHLHPECRITESENQILLERENHQLLVVWNPVRVGCTIEDSLYTPAFGIHLQNHYISLRLISNDMSNICYVLSPPDSLDEAIKLIQEKT